MKQTILDRISLLGGNINNVQGHSLQADLQSIEFKHPLYPLTYTDEFYGADKFYEENKQLYVENKQLFYNNLIAHFFSDHEIPYGQSFFRNFLFTPFKKNTDDYGELDGLVEENDIRQVVTAQDLDFLCICYSYGFPDHFFICLTDPNPENPTVYSTDHEVYFQEIDNEGTLEEFFTRFLTKDEFLKAIQHYIDNEKGNNP